MACKIGDSVGKAVYISPKHVKCVVEDMDLVNEGEYLPA
jgi:H2-forming N5,N10-methylenetetrahydromethanopterin dehydrogenase-like enzyme